MNFKEENHDSCFEMTKESKQEKAIIGPSLLKYKLRSSSLCQQVKSGNFLGTLIANNQM